MALHVRRRLALYARSISSCQAAWLAGLSVFVVVVVVDVIVRSAGWPRIALLHSATVVYVFLSRGTSPRACLFVSASLSSPPPVPTSVSFSRSVCLSARSVLLYVCFDLVLRLENATARDLVALTSRCSVVRCVANALFGLSRRREPASYRYPLLLQLFLASERCD